MTAAAIAAAAIFAYPLVAAVVLVYAGRRVDAAFVRDMNRVLRSRAGGGSGEADQSHPQGRSATAGVERGRVPHVAAAAPPAPYPLAGAVYPAPAPARPPRVAVHG